MSSLLSILSSLGFNWHVALANFINFLIIFFIIKKFFFEKIKNVIRERDSVIKKGLSDASDAAKKLSSAADDALLIEKSAKDKAKGIVHDAGLKATLLEEEARKRGVSEAEIIVKEAKEIYDSAHARAEKDFAKHSPELVAALASKVLGETMTKEINDALIMRALK